MAAIKSLERRLEAFYDVHPTLYFRWFLCSKKLGHPRICSISYAHVDNLTAAGSTNGWVSQFHQQLEIQLWRRVGRSGSVAIWRDRLGHSAGLAERLVLSLNTLTARSWNKVMASPCKTFSNSDSRPACSRAQF